jgi:hypothetical protein
MKKSAFALLPVLLLALSAPAFACKCAEVTPESSRAAIDGAALIVKGLVERVYESRKGADVNRPAVIESGAVIDVEQVYKGQNPGDSFKLGYDSQTDCGVKLDPGREGEFIVQKEGDAYRLAGQCARLTDADWAALRKQGAATEQEAQNAPVAGDDCDDIVGRRALAGIYTIIGHGTAGPAPENLYSGQALVELKGCKLMVTRCVAGGGQVSGELEKTPSLTMRSGARHYSFTPGIDTLSATYGDGGEETGREFWYRSVKGVAPVCLLK